MSKSEYRVLYYLEHDKFVAQRRQFGYFHVTPWKSLGRWTDTKEEAEQNIEKAKAIEATGVSIA